MGVSIWEGGIPGQSRAVSVRYQFGIRPNAIFSLTRKKRWSTLDRLPLSQGRRVIDMDLRPSTFAALPKRDTSISDGRVLLNAVSLKGLRKQHGLSQETLAEACLNRHLCVSIASLSLIHI